MRDPLISVEVAKHRTVFDELLAMGFYHGSLVILRVAGKVKSEKYLRAGEDEKPVDNLV